MDGLPKDNVTHEIIQNIERSLQSAKQPSITYLIGNNGTGKSRLLALVCDIYEQQYSSPVKSVLCISSSMSDRFISTDGKRRKYLGVRTVGNAIFLSAIDRQVAQYLTLGIKPGKRQFIQTVENAVGVNFRLEFNSRFSTMTPTKLDDAVDKRKIKNISVSQLISPEGRAWLAKIIREGIDINKITIKNAKFLKVYLDLNPDVSLIVRSTHGRLPFHELSSGEQNRIGLALKIISYAEDNSLILIDEPEISLHLKWQMEFHAFLKEIMSAYKSYHVVIATHSPVIVSEAAKDRGTNTILVLREMNNKLKTSREQLDSISFTTATTDDIDSCEGLTLDFFDIATYNTAMVDFRIAEAVLDATDPAKEVEPEVRRLTALLGKEGMDPEKKRTIRKAISLIKKHLGEIPA